MGKSHDRDHWVDSDRGRKSRCVTHVNVLRVVTSSLPVDRASQRAVADASGSHLMGAEQAKLIRVAAHLAHLPQRSIELAVIHVRSELQRLLMRAQYQFCPSRSLNFCGSFRPEQKMLFVCTGQRIGIFGLAS